MKHTQWLPTSLEGKVPVLVYSALLIDVQLCGVLY